MTLTIKGRTNETKVKITSTTKITKDGQPAEFSDAAEGLRADVRGKKGEDGVWTATTLRIMTKAPTPRTPPAAGTAPKPQ